MFKMPKLVGVLNVTPDSFSDGGLYFKADNAVKKFRELIEDGANVIDVGAESRKPGKGPGGKIGETLISSEEEMKRLSNILPLLVPISAKSDVEISIDTRHAVCAAWALGLGVHWLNDAGGFSDDEMVKVALDFPDVKLVLMHNLGISGDHTTVVMDEDKDPIKGVSCWFRDKLNFMRECGIDTGRVVLDVGIGYGKTSKQSWTLIRRIKELVKLGNPLYVGHSRKSMYATLGVNSPLDRDLETITTSCFLADQGVSYLRVHDVRGHKKSLRALSELHKNETVPS